MQEIVSLTADAFNLADEYRMPVMILGDGTLGQMMEPVDFDSVPAPVESNKDWATTGTGLKREHNIINSLYLVPEGLEAKIRERQKRYDIITEHEVRYEAHDLEDAEIVLTAYGTTSRVAESAVKELRQEGIKVGMIRPITLWPFPTEIFAKAAKTAKAFLSVEMSMGQMVEDVRLAVNGAAPVYFYGRTGGIIPTPAEIVAEVKKIAGGNRS